MNIKEATVDPQIIADLVRDSLAQGLRPKLTIVSKSMTPLLRIDDQIAIEACTVDQLVAGDIVVISAENALYTHRFCQIVLHHDAKQYLLTRGDRALAYDPLWPAETLIGRAVAIYRGNNMLSLTDGGGYRLHKRLARLARWEEKQFANAAVTLDWHGLATAENRQLGRAWRMGWFRPIFRLIRLKLYSWRIVMIKVAELVVSTKDGSHTIG